MRTTSKTAVNDTYLQLVRSFPLRRIKNTAEHAKASKILLRLSISKPDGGTRDYVDVLVDLIADYEKRANLTVDISDVTAADLIRHRLEERGMSVSALAREIGIPQSNLSEMLSGRRDWSKSAIRALSKFFNMRTERFFV